MRSKKKSTRKDIAPIHIELPVAPAAASPDQGAAGQAAARAATLHQLERFAEQVEQYVNDAQMDSLLDRVQAELQRNPDSPPLRLRRE